MSIHANLLISKIMHVNHSRNMYVCNVCQLLNPKVLIKILHNFKKTIEPKIISCMFLMQLRPCFGYFFRSQWLNWTSKEFCKHFQD